MVSTLVFMAGWRLRSRDDAGYLPLLGGAFLAVALIDVMHTLSYVGMPAFISPNSVEKAINFWLAGRLIAIGSLLAMALLMTRTPRKKSEVYIWASTLAGIAVSLLVLYIVIWHGNLLPRTFIAGEGLTSFKIASEYLLVVISLIAAARFAWLAFDRHDATFGWLGGAALAFALAELFFTLYSSVTDLMNLMGHAFKTFGCMAIYAAFFIRRGHQPWWSIRSRLNLLIPLLAGIFGIEYLIMVSMPYLIPTGINPLIEAMIDASAMAIIASGVILLLVDRFQARAMRAEYALDHTNDGYCVINEQGAFVDANVSFCRMFGYLQERILNMDIFAFEPPSLPEEKRIDIPRIIQLGHASYQTQLRDRDGNIIDFDVSATHLPAVNSIVLFLQDITTLKHFEQQIDVLSSHDQLTQLPNRQLFLEHLTAAMSNSARNNQYGAVLVINLDNFKQLNHAKGNVVGDEFLIATAKQLGNCVGPVNTVARIGGDEFAIVLENLGESASLALSGSQEMVEKLRRAIAAPAWLGSQGEVAYQGSACIGITLFFDHREVPEILLQQAAIAMHQAKEKSYNSFRFFSGEMRKVATDHIELTEALRIAINKELLELYYQPQVDRNGRIFSAEVLLRWQHPVKGFVSPAHFIPLAEETGLIKPLGRWVIREACRQLKVWQEETGNGEFSLSVNVSSAQFGAPNFIAEVRDMIDGSGIAAGTLKLELTESMLVENVEGVVKLMQELDRSGIRFSLDDFGTGYSMLSYLTALPLDELKIDQSFVRDIGTDPNHVAVVRTIINMGHALGLHIIAEGVEREDELAVLEQNGCHAYQGYLFSRPLPADAFIELLRRGKTEWPPEEV